MAIRERAFVAGRLLSFDGLFTMAALLLVGAKAGERNVLVVLFGCADHLGSRGLCARGSPPLEFGG